jgi:hypothetical protein
MAGDLRDDVSEISKARERADARAEDALGHTKYAAAAADVAKAVIRPNMVFNFEKTAAERERAIAAVRPVYRYVHGGDLIISKGEMVTREHIEKLAALGLRQRRIDYRNLISLSALVALLVGLAILYLAK